MERLARKEGGARGEDGDGKGETGTGTGTGTGKGVRGVPLQRLGHVRDVADATVYLFSQAGDYVSGGVLVGEFFFQCFSRGYGVGGGESVFSRHCFLLSPLLLPLLLSFSLACFPTEIRSSLTFSCITLTVLVHHFLLRHIPLPPSSIPFLCSILLLPYDTIPYPIFPLPSSALLHLIILSSTSTFHTRQFTIFHPPSYTDLHPPLPKLNYHLCHRYTPLHSTPLHYSYHITLRTNYRLLTIITVDGAAWRVAGANPGAGFAYPDFLLGDQKVTGGKTGREREGGRMAKAKAKL